MTKKDYELIAKAIQQARQCCSEAGGAWSVAEHIAQALKNENPRFDYHKFMKACSG